MSLDEIVLEALDKLSDKELEDVLIASLPDLIATAGIGAK